MRARQASPRMALAGGSGEEDFYRAKIETARFYAAHVLPLATSLAAIVTGGAESVTAAAPSRWS